MEFKAVCSESGSSSAVAAAGELPLQTAWAHGGVRKGQVAASLPEVFPEAGSHGGAELGSGRNWGQRWLAGHCGVQTGLRPLGGKSRAGRLAPWGLDCHLL